MITKLSLEDGQLLENLKLELFIPYLFYNNFLNEDINSISLEFI